jgi:hypothetical protein
MAFFSIENILNHKIVKNIVNINSHVIINDLLQTERIKEDNLSLSLKHPKVCQPKIPIKDRSSLIRPNLKTTDDIFDIQTSITSILSHSEELEYKTINPYYKWDCENFSEEYGYTHFYVVVSLVIEDDQEPYYAIELQRITGTKPIIRYILHELTERLNIL